MQILTPQIIRDVKKKEEEKTRSRVSALAREESEVVFRINLLRQEEDEYVDRKRVRDLPKNQAELSVTKTVLEREVEGLETRKRVALQPIIDREQEASTLLAEVKKSAKYNEEWAGSLRIETSTLKSREIDVIARENKIKASDQEITQRMSELKDCEVEVKRQTNVLATEKATYAVQIANDYEAITLRESRLKQEQTIIEDERKRLNERSKKQDERDRQLKDRYETLQRAIVEIEEKKNI